MQVHEVSGEFVRIVKGKKHGWVKALYVDWQDAPTEVDSEADDTGEFVPEAIKKHRGGPGRREFFVSWVGWPGADTWEPATNLGDDHPLLLSYLEEAGLSLN